MHDHVQQNPLPKLLFTLFLLWCLPSIIYICINFYSYSKIDTNENNMKIRMCPLLWTTIRKARNHCQDVDHCLDEEHCQYHLGIDHCQTGNHQDREHCQNGNEHRDDQDKWSALKHN